MLPVQSGEHAERSTGVFPFAFHFLMMIETSPCCRKSGFRSYFSGERLH